MIQNVSVIGAGTMGHGIAHVFAQAGCRVTLFDLSEKLLAKGRQSIQKKLERMANESYISHETRKKTAENLSYSVNLFDSVKDADLIVEAIPEVLEWKADLFKQLAPLMRPSAIVASNTSTISISELAEGCRFSDRLIIMHFFNPAQLIKLVEIVKLPQTDQKVIDQSVTLLKRAGKKAIVLNKDIPGFIANRLQAALVREAFYLLEEGVASAEDIDRAVTDGPGMRWALNGPLKIADMGGLDIWEKVTGNLFPELDCRKEAPSLITASVQQGNLGAKTGKGIYDYTDRDTAQEAIRDGKLMQLLKM